MIKQYITKAFIIGILIGGIAGYAYYYFVGCKNGSCGITGDPINSTFYGMAIGGLITWKKKEPKEKENKSE